MIVRLYCLRLNALPFALSGNEWVLIVYISTLSSAIDSITAVTIIGFRKYLRLRSRPRALASHEGHRKSVRSMSVTRLSEAKE